MTVTNTDLTTSPTNRTLIRAGAIAGLAGGAIGIVSNLTHPVADDLNDSLAQVQLVADSDGWLVGHLGAMFGVLLVTLFIDTLRTTITRPLAATLARFALIFQIVAAATIVVLIGIDGIASKEVFDEWALATGTEREILDQIVVVVERIDVGIFTTFLIVQYGLVFALIGSAVALSGRYNPFLGLGAALIGLYGTVVGLVWAFNGLTTTTASLGFGALLGNLAWVIVMATVMLRNDSSAHQPTTD